MSGCHGAFALAGVTTQAQTGVRHLSLSLEQVRLNAAGPVWSNTHFGLFRSCIDRSQAALWNGFVREETQFRRSIKLLLPCVRWQSLLPSDTMSAVHRSVFLPSKEFVVRTTKSSFSFSATYPTVSAMSSPGKKWPLGSNPAQQMPLSSFTSPEVAPGCLQHPLFLLPSLEMGSISCDPNTN